MRMLLELNRDEINNLQYPVIVESWDRKMGSFSFKRKYRKEFTEKERQLIRVYYNNFYRWYLVKGTPEKHCLRYSTLNLIERAVNFFACN